MSPLREQTQNTFTDASWFTHNEGQLLVDVTETPREIIIKSAISGVQAHELEITLAEDTLTIRGSRHEDTKTHPNTIVHTKECHWGSFSRSIILPNHVDPTSVDALLKKGVLTIRLKKIQAETGIDVLDLDDY